MDNSSLGDRLRRALKNYAVHALVGFVMGVGLIAFLASTNGEDITLLPPAESGHAGTSTPIISNPGDQSINTPGDGLVFGTTGLDTPQVGPITLLLVGMDRRPEEKHIGNTDCLILASLDRERKKVVLLSVPRDSQVSWPGKPKEKINAVARLGKGIPSTKSYLEELTGIRINGYIATNFQGFKEMIDALGGITLTVEKNMVYDTGDREDHLIDLKKGTQRLSGSQALQYARFRNDELADISRTERQQRVVRAILKEATHPQNILKFPLLLPKVYDAIETDLSLSHIWDLALVLKERQDFEIVTQTLPGSFAVEEGVSYWKVNQAQAKQVFPQLFRGEKITVFDNAKHSLELSTAVQSQPQLKNGTRGQPEKEDPSPQPSLEEASEITFEIVNP